MLDVLERLTGRHLDSLGFGVSLWLHGMIRPHATPQTLCSAIIEARLWWLAFMIGVEHCMREWWRYR